MWHTKLSQTRIDHDRGWGSTDRDAQRKRSNGPGEMVKMVKTYAECIVGYSILETT